jgi:DNA-binding transcriptional MerR regulator
LQVAQLRFIRQANLAGLTLAEVKKLLALIAEGERGENLPRANEVLEEKMREAEKKMEEISAFRDSLLSYLRRFEENEK